MKWERIAQIVLLSLVIGEEPVSILLTLDSRSFVVTSHKLVDPGFAAVIYIQGPDHVSHY